MNCNDANDVLFRYQRYLFRYLFRYNININIMLRILLTNRNLSFRDRNDTLTNVTIA